MNCILPLTTPRPTSRFAQPVRTHTRMWIGCCVAVLWLSLQPAARAQTALPNGSTQTGTLASAGAVDSWVFAAKAGESMMVRVGSTNFTPHLQLYAPDNTMVQETTSGNGFTRDGYVQFGATSSGNYTVLVGASFSGQTGSYGISLAVAAEPVVVSPGDQGGALTNGVFNLASLDRGDVDVWTFSANQGEGIVLRVGSTNFTPWIQLYGPAGGMITNTTSGNGFTRDGFVAASAPTAGTYTVVVTAAFQDQFGGYGLNLALALEPFVVSAGDQGGALVNGTFNLGTIERGDLDLWSFSAQAGDGLMIRVGSTNFTPRIQLYGPSGDLVTNTTSGNGFTRDGYVALQAPQTGGYTIVLSAAFPDQFGGYGLSLAEIPEPFIVSPGDDGGVLTNGVANVGELDRGDLDLWSFAANAGSSIMLRVGSTNFTPWIRLYGPDGALVTDTTSGNGFTRDGVLSAQAAESGTYTVIVTAAFQDQFGGYELSLALAPAPISVSNGDQGGGLVDGVTYDATITLGDLDVWSFYGTPGDSNVLKVTATDFTPWIRVYDPSGALVAETKSGNGFTREGSVSLTVTNTGTYTAVVSATFAGQFSPYTFKQSRVPPDLNVPETQTIAESTPLSVSISAQDPDAPVKPLVFKLLSGPAGLTLQTPTGATNATLSWATAEADGPSTNLVTVTVTDRVNNQDFIRTNSFTVVVNEINTAPALTVPTDQVLDEQTPLNVVASAVDSDIPANQLTFSLLNPPDGMTIDRATGAISWLPTEAQGPSTNTVTVVVTDFSPAAVNAQHLSDTNSFTVTVRETNHPPQLTVPADQTLDELVPLHLSAAATDSDVPANALIFSLVTAPPGMTIDPASGLISWTPGENQGPSTNTVTVMVTDFNPAAISNQHLSDTKSFTVVVNEVNQAPQISGPGDQVIDALRTLSVTASATDSDLPANPLTFSLIAPPTGMAIDPTSGAITWTPTTAQGPSTNTITVVVTDSNPWAAKDQHLSATNSFTVIVRVNTAPSLQSIPDTSLHFDTPLSITAVAADADVPAQTLTFSLDPGAPAGLTINAATGVMAWTPSQAQLGTYPVTVRVTDNGLPALSATTTFHVTVTGSGSRLDIQQAAPFVQVTITGDVGNNYELQKSADLVNWEKLFDISPLTSSPFNYIDPESKTNVVRFYRLKLVP